MVPQLSHTLSPVCLTQSQDSWVSTGTYVVYFSHNTLYQLYFLCLTAKYDSWGFLKELRVFWSNNLETCLRVLLSGRDDSLKLSTLALPSSLWGDANLPAETGFSRQSPHLDSAPLTQLFVSPLHCPSLSTFPSSLPTSTAPSAPWGVCVKGQLGIIFCLRARIPFRVQEGGTSCSKKTRAKKQRLQFCLHDTKSLGRVTDSLGGGAMDTRASRYTDVLEKRIFTGWPSLEPYLHPAHPSTKEGHLPEKDAGGQGKKGNCLHYTSWFWWIETGIRS